MHKKGNIGVFQMKKLQHIRLREGSKADQFLSGQLTSKYFSYQEIFAMLMPLIFDQFFISVIALLTTAMISSSSQESVSAVSLVSPLYMMIYAVYSAISSAGTVIIAQYKGHGDEEKMKKAAGQIVMFTFVTAVVFSVLLILFAEPLIRTMFAGADELIIKKATDYLIGCAFSFIFLSVYMGGFAVFRGIGETQICLRLSMVVNTSLPFAMEQLCFNGGGIIVSMFIVKLGTESIAANAVSNSTLMVYYSMGLAVPNLVSLAALLPFLRIILKLYQAPENTLGQIYMLLAIAFVPMALLWSTSNVLPNVLRAAGDVNFTSYVSLITMWLIRSVIFIMRFHSDRWLNQKTAV